MHNIRNKETDLIKSFSQKSSPYHILVKSEGGKNKALKLYTSIVNYVDVGIKILILLDLDGRKSDSIISKLNKIFSSESRRLSIEKNNVIYKNKKFL